MAKKAFDVDAVYDYVNAAMAPRQALIEAEYAIKAMIGLKREWLTGQESKEQEKVLGRDPYFEDSVAYDEEILDGVTVTKLKYHLIAIAKKYKLFISNGQNEIVNDFMLIDALARRSQEWFHGGKKRENMPAFAVLGKTRKARFMLSLVAARLAAGICKDTDHYLTLGKKNEAELLPHSGTRVFPTEEKQDKAVPVTQEFHGDVAKAQAEPSVAEELARLRAENAALLAKEAGKEYVNTPLLADMVNAFGQIVSH